MLIDCTICGRAHVAPEGFAGEPCPACGAEFQRCWNCGCVWWGTDDAWCTKCGADGRQLLVACVKCGFEHPDSFDECPRCGYDGKENPCSTA
jgi:predicted RNA-binding Zn-ribbon protein involved in translation (DUF1610 family)